MSRQSGTCSGRDMMLAAPITPLVEVPCGSRITAT
jgi:hypothetical protein